MIQFKEENLLVVSESCIQNYLHITQTRSDFFNLIFDV